MTLVLDRYGFRVVRYYREQTVREFAVQKTTLYRSRRTALQRVMRWLADCMCPVPWFRNKMVAVAIAT